MTALRRAGEAVCKSRSVMHAGDEAPASPGNIPALARPPKRSSGPRAGVVRRGSRLKRKVSGEIVERKT